MAGDELDKFVSEIIEAKKLSGVSAEVREQLVADMKQRLVTEINRALIDALPDEKMSEFNTLLDNDDVTEEQVQAFVMNSGVDVQRITAQTMLLFRSLYLTSAEERDTQ